MKKYNYNRSVEEAIEAPAVEEVEVKEKVVKPTKPIETRRVKVIYGNCIVREEKSSNSQALGVAEIYSIYPYGGEQTEEWNSIIYKGRKAWLWSGMSRLMPS